ncbi:MAG TPA: hypothetical protein VGY49_01865 [Burkholderiaceae bacterium]|jgi:hypothetical protein|nr:hypothetical protein [Burkholderiaceae bacterium]
MGAREHAYFELTLKGAEELAQRTYRLDAKIRNILFLIQKGYATVEGILENSIFPRDEVVERLRDLLRGHFVTLHGEKLTSTTIQKTPDTRYGPATPPEATAPEPEPEPEPTVQQSTYYFGGL